MTYSTNLQEELRNLFMKNREGEVLKRLVKIFKQKEKRNEAYMHFNNYSEWKKENRLGLMSGEKQHLYNKIKNSILELIDEITEEEAKTYEAETSIFEKILIVCKTKDRQPFMKELFSERYWKGVEYDVEEARSIEEINTFNLIVFDHYPHDPEDIQLLKYYLNRTEPYLLYFGKPLPLLYSYDEKVYFTNSMFSLHARIEEMFTFLKYYKPSS